MAGTNDVVIPAFTDKELTVKGDAELLPQNIRNGVNLFGVVGTMSEGVDLSALGITRMATGTFRFASDTPVSIPITHGMGVVPKLIIFNQNRGNPYASPKEMVAGGYYMKFLSWHGAGWNTYGTSRHYYRGDVNSNTFQFESEVASHHDTANYMENEEYIWYAFA